MSELRAFVTAQLHLMRPDHLRGINPTPYKVSLSTSLYSYLHEMMMTEVPIPELS